MSICRLFTYIQATNNTGKQQNDLFFEKIYTSYALKVIFTKQILPNHLSLEGANHTTQTTLISHHPNPTPSPAYILRKELDLKELSLLEYIQESDYIYDAQLDYLQAEKEYMEAVSELYRIKL